MKKPGHYHPALETVDSQAARSSLRRRGSASYCLLFMVIGVITGVGPALIFAAGQAGKQATAGEKSAGPSAGNADHGKQLFKRYGCYECHGSHGQIVSRTGPALAPNLVPFKGFAAYVRRPAGSMPPYTDKVVSEQDLSDIYAFLQSASHPPAPESVPLLNLVGGRP
jgi:mono/diheme cytochrome c family protein